MRKKYLTLSIMVVLIFGFGMAGLSSPLECNIEPLRNSEQKYLNAALMWSDNFDDGDMDEWITHEFQGYEPNYTVIDGIVYSQGEDYMNIAGHNSSVVYGTWSIDVYVNRPTGIEIIETAAIGTGYSQDAYEVVFDPDVNQVYFQELYATSDTTWGSIVHDRKDMNPLGWHHLDVTRDLKGYFCVYLNRSLILEAVDLTVTTSNVFAVAFAGAFDNVVVNNTVDIDLVGPRFVDPPTDQTINEGEKFQYRINATDVHYVNPNAWAVNDTEHFTIDRDGIISNATILEPGVYGIEVSAGDNLDNNRTVTFSVTVLPVPTSFDPLLLAVVGGGIAIVIVIALVIMMKKRT